MAKAKKTKSADPATEAVIAAASPPEEAMPMDPPEENPAPATEEPAAAMPDDPVEKLTPHAGEGIEYICVHAEGNKFGAAILRNGYPMAFKEAPSKFDAMVLRDTAKAAGATSFPE